MGLYKQSNSPNYWMSFSVNGRQIKRSTGTTDKKLAEAIIGKVKAQVVEGKWFEVDQAKSHTFDDMMEKFMREYAPTKKTSTQGRYIYSLKHLDNFFKGMTLADITSSVISDYIEKRKTEGAENGTINREFAMLSKAFSLTYKQWGWVRENLCSKVQKLPENNQVDRWLTHEESERLLKGCYDSASSIYSSSKDGYLNGQLPDIVTLALHTAMRQGEILNLKWSDIDLFRKVITVTETKNKTPKTIPMSDTLYNLLLQKSKVRTMSGYLFTTGNGTRIRARNLIREFDKATAKAGIEDFTFHCLRHTAATWMIQSGIDIYTVSKILGHKDIKTTMRYAHHCPDSLRHGVRAIDNFMKNTLKNKVEKEAISG